MSDETTNVETPVAPTEPTVSDDIFATFASDFGTETKKEETPTEPVEEIKEKEEAPVPAPAEEPVETPAPTKDTLDADEITDRKLAMEAIKALQARTEKTETPEVLEEKKKEDLAEFLKPIREIPNYAIQVPHTVVNKLFNEDATMEDREAALNEYSAGIAQTVHGQILKTMGKWVEDQINVIPNLILHTVENYNKNTTQGEQTKAGFFKEFPELNKPEYTPLLRDITAKTAVEMKVKTWTPALQKAVGEKVKAVLASFGGIAPVAPGAPAAKPANKLAPTGATPPPPAPKSQDPNSPENIQSVWDNSWSG